VGFLKIFIGNLMRLGGSTQLGQRGQDSDRYGGRRQDTDGGLAVAQLCGDAVTVRLVQAEPLVVKCAEDAAANDPGGEAYRSEQRESQPYPSTLAGTALAHLLSFDLALVVEDQHTDRIIVSQSGILQALRGSIRRGFVLEDCQHNDLVCHEHPFPWSGNSNRPHVRVTFPFLAGDAEWDAMTMQDFLDQSDLSPAQKMIAQVTLEITYAAPLREMTLLNTLVEMKGCGGYEGQGATGSGVPQYHVVGGTAGISERIAEYLGDVVRLSSPVTAVSNWQEDQGPVRLETPSGTVEADRVIMAMGASLASQISYDPELPELRQGLHDTVDKDHCLIKTHTTYERPFWRDMNLSGGIISPDGVFTVCADVTPPETTKGVLVTLVRSPREGDGTPMSPEDRKAATIEMFAKCFGDEALSPTGWVMQDWLAETYTRGIVAVLSPGLYLKYGPALRAPTGRMIWGGTEISLFWTSYLDGAVRGGHQSALMALGALAESRSAG
jgi:hypothetical protein